MIGGNREGVAKMVVTWSLKVKGPFNLRVIKENYKGKKQRIKNQQRGDDLYTYHRLGKDISVNT